MNSNELKDFYKGKKVFITGHTGFKGTWLCKILELLGAEVYGYALEPATEPNIFQILDVSKNIHSIIGDIRDYEKLRNCIKNIAPEYIFHLAAQPIVRESYRIPRETFEVNVMGTINLLECIRTISGVVSFLNVTTDKVYENYDIEDHAFTEEEKLNGYDPYSNSKSCSELVTHSYKKSFFYEKGATAISTARAGNVIGGGDFAKDRIIPDCVRAAVKGNSIHIRNPYSIRPYQHVLEPLIVYLIIVMKQAQNIKYSGYYNVGPDDKDCITTGELADLFVKFWGEGVKWNNLSEKDIRHEASFLKLNCTKLKDTFAWNPVWHVEDAVRETVYWYKAWKEKRDMIAITEAQIRDFLK